MFNATMYTSAGDVLAQDFEHQDLADASLLDHLRGAGSFDKKAFAIVTDDGVSPKFVVIEGNCTVWLSPEEFFAKVAV